MKTLPKNEKTILGLLVKHGNLYGLQMFKLAKGKLKKGGIYQTLYRMEHYEYVYSKTVMIKNNDNPMRVMYYLTPEGRRVFKTGVRLPK